MTAPQATVAGIHLLDILDALEALGVQPGRLCSAAGLQVASLHAPEVRLPAGMAVRLFAEAERLTGDAVVGLHAGERARPRGPLIYLLMSSPRLEDGLRQVARFSRLVVDTLRVAVDVHGEQANLVFDLGDPRLETSRHTIEYLLMASFRSVHRVVEETFRLDEVHFRHADGNTGAEVARAFGCPVRFLQRDNRLVYPLCQMHAASPFANPRIAQQIEKFAATAIPAATLRDRVANVAREILAAGHRPDKTTVARRIGMSERSLQRRLRDEQATFRVVCDVAVRQVVEALLSNPRLKLEAVALSVGFADGAALAKAVRRWAGCSPAEYRKRLAGETAGPIPDSPRVRS